MSKRNKIVIGSVSSVVAIAVVVTLVITLVVQPRQRAAAEAHQAAVSAFNAASQDCQNANSHFTNTMSDAQQNAQVDPSTLEYPSLVSQLQTAIANAQAVTPCVPPAMAEDTATIQQQTATLRADTGVVTNADQTLAKANQTIAVSVQAQAQLEADAQTTPPATTNPVSAQQPAPAVAPDSAAVPAISLSTADLDHLMGLGENRNGGGLSRFFSLGSDGSSIDDLIWGSATIPNMPPVQRTFYDAIMGINGQMVDIPSGSNRLQVASDSIALGDGNQVMFVQYNASTKTVVMSFMNPDPDGNTAIGQLTGSTTSQNWKGIMSNAKKAADTANDAYGDSAKFRLSVNNLYASGRDELGGLCVDGGFNGDEVLGNCGTLAITNAKMVYVVSGGTSGFGMNISVAHGGGSKLKENISNLTSDDIQSVLSTLQAQSQAPVPSYSPAGDYPTSGVDLYNQWKAAIANDAIVSA